jgi:hypothetical protein
MLAFALPSRVGAGEDLADPSLEDAREALEYWERRASQLPLHAVGKRREAREMAARWQARVTEAERTVYGRGVLGALLLVATERRLPQQTVSTGRMLARRTVQAALAVTLTLVALFILGVVAVAELLLTLVHALS